MARMDKPAKPRPDYPCYAHRNGQWAKKIEGRTLFFGSWRDDPHGVRAEQAYRQFIDDPMPEGLTVADSLNLWLHMKNSRRKTGELGATTFRGYKMTAERVLAVIARNRLVDELTPADFERLRTSMAETLSLASIDVELSKVRVWLNWVEDTYDVRVKTGQSLRKPAKKNMLKQRTRKEFSRDEILTMLNAAEDQRFWRAAILLGINGGYGPSDLNHLRTTHIRWDEQLIEFPRPKTAEERVTPLWDETTEALKALCTTSESVFTRADGSPLERETAECTRYLSARFRAFIEPLGLWQPHRGFYTLRRMHRTISDTAGGRRSDGAQRRRHGRDLRPANRRRATAASGRCGACVVVRVVSGGSHLFTSLVTSQQQLGDRVERPRAQLQKPTHGTT